MVYHHIYSAGYISVQKDPITFINETSFHTRANCYRSVNAYDNED